MKTLNLNFGGKSKKVVGIDVGSSSVKLVELEGSDEKNLVLTKYSIEKLPQELMSTDGKFPNIESVGDFVRKCWKRSGSNIKSIAISLPQSSIISKKALIPALDSEEDLKNQVQSEMEKYLPTGLSINDIALDFFSYGPNAQSPTENDMLIIASKKEQIDERLALVQSAGLNPVILESEQSIIQNVLRLVVGEKFNLQQIMLVDCSAHTMKIMVFKNGENVYNKENNIGGMNLTTDLQLNLGLSSYTDAEKFKIDGDNTETSLAVTKTFLNNLSSEFLRSFQYFSSVAAKSEVEHVYFTGGTVATPGFLDAIKNVISEADEKNIFNYSLLNPLEGIQKSNSINLAKVAKDENTLFLAFGLAFRQLLRKY